MGVPHGSDSNPISSWSYLAGVIVLVVFWIALWEVIGFGQNGPNVWFFFVTTIVAYLFADGITIIFEQVAALSKNEILIPAKFAVFLLVILIGGLIGESSVGWVKDTLFASPASTALSAVFLDVIPTTLLWGDFLYRQKFRRHPKKPQVVGTGPN